MRRAFAFIAFAACLVGFLRHRPRRAGRMGGWRCERCKRAFADLDDAGEIGSGYVSPARPIYTRHGDSGRAEVSRDGVGPIQ